MSKSYYSLGLMSGTSMDGVDASIINSDGELKYKLILNKYFQYNEDFYGELTSLRDKINSSKDLKTLTNDLESVEKEITTFHAKTVHEMIKESNVEIDFIGFHGQTIFHNPDEKISKQLGDGKLLSKLTKKVVVYDFRQNDLNNGGQGAPLSPVFHMLLKNKYKLKQPLVILNIGGIANVTGINLEGYMYSQDIGPGNCLIDQWIRQNSKKKYDDNGEIAQSGKINKIILNQALENFSYNNSLKSYDIKDFDTSFVRGLSLEDGAATLTEYTSEILQERLKISFDSSNKNILITGGGRKNKFLVKSIEEKINIPIKLVDDFGIDGDFVESQAFAYLAVRSFLGLPISYPETTGCREACTGGVIVKNF
jgi:anhydro-N-acetylmuramic acid kinase